MTIATRTLTSPVRPVTSFAFLSHSAILSPVSAEKDATAQAVDAEELRWQLEWERRNIED